MGKQLAVQAGTRAGRAAGYATPAERYSKSLRFKALAGRLARAERQAGAGRVRVTRGTRKLMRARLNLEDAGITEQQWRQRWEASRLFLQADGETGKNLGNETLRWHPGEDWLEIRLHAPLAHLANRPRARYRLSCPVRFTHRGDEVADRAATSTAVQYAVSYDPVKDRWYLDAAWQAPARPLPPMGELRTSPVIAVDVNAGHLAVAVVAPDGNVTGTPFTVTLPLDGLPATARDGRVRSAVTQLISFAREHGAQALVIEDLDFKAAREQGRERTGSRPSRGRRGRSFRRSVAGIPTARFRDRLVQMTASGGLSVVVVDPAYSSRWSAIYWLAPLREHHPETTGHHAAALVLGRRGLGHRARRRATGNRTAPADAMRPAQARTRKPPVAKTAPRKPARPRDKRQPPGSKTGTPHRTRTGNQAGQDRPDPPDNQDYLLLSQLGTVVVP
jgi:IS605 OrfB family transposase